MIITIDGPTASGKSTIARRLACDLNIMYLNTGLLYRAFAYCLVHECGYAPDTAQDTVSSKGSTEATDTRKTPETCAQMRQLSSPELEDIAFVLDSGLIAYDYAPVGGAIINYRGVPIADELKLPHVDRWASVISAQPAVRAALLDLQRRLAQQKDTVAEGRDCGTVVFPTADYKFFITATPETRAHRWRTDQHNRGVVLSLDEALGALAERDTRDSTRAAAPLVIPPDAHVIDNSRLTVRETVDYIKELIGRSTKLS